MRFNPSSLLAFLVMCLSAGAIFSSQASGGTLATLYAFTAGPGGSNPESAVVRATSGILYGETEVSGGALCVNQASGSRVGCGTLYSFAPSTGLRTLAEFTGLNGAIGGNAPLLVGTTLYGSTIYGGVTDNGVLFSVHTDGTGFTILHHFTGLDGSGPIGPLVGGPGHVLYGIAASGGPTYSGDPYASYGVLFSITPTGGYTILHVFTNGADGGTPTSLVVEKSGIIIGSTQLGGNKTSRFCGSAGCGVVFTYDPATAAFSVPHTFTGQLGDGAAPALGSLASDGTAYGNAGSFFSIGPAGYASIPTTTYPPDGIGFAGFTGPTLGKDGSLTQAEPILQIYGETYPGDLYQQLNGVITQLWAFSNGADGGFPYGQPLLSPAGTFIGTTSSGGPNPLCECGTIYEYTP